VAVAARALIPLLLACAPLRAGTVESALRETVETAYPELEGLRLELRSFEDDEFYFQARVDAWTVWKPARERTYAIYVHPELRRDPPPPKALRAVLAHELEHVLGYAKMSRWELLRLAFAYAFGNEAKIAHYERATDARVVDRCLGSGLAAYKRWAFDRLPESSRAKRARRYLSIAEIEASAPSRCGLSKEF
jgi:hypothetical protein